MNLLKSFSVRQNGFPLGFLLSFFLFLALVPQAAEAGNSSPGELDTSFNPQIIKENQTIGNALLVQPDGKFIVGGFFLTVDRLPRNYVARFNADGTLDASFASGGSLNGSVAAMALQPDGKIIVAGSFDAVAGQARKNIARLNSDGSLDPTFSVSIPSFAGAFTAVAVQADGKVLFSGNFSSVGGQTRNGFARVNADGSLDAAFNPPCTNGGVLAVQTDGKILIGNSCGAASGGGVSRLTSAGAVDATFNVGTGANGGAVKTIVLQPNAKILIGGQFSSFNGRTGRGIARVNADGSLDNSFAPSTDFSTNTIALQPDGKILLARSFAFAGANTVFRINADGTNDAAFNQNETQVGDVNSLAVLPNGKIIETGKMNIDGANFSTVYKPLLRLNSNGLIDAAFDPYIVFPSLSAGINNVVVQPDGKILVAGQFSEVNKQSRSTLVRFNADGTLDSSFNLGANTGIFNGTINALALQTDGKILVGGSLPTGDADRIQRLNADGSRDAAFNVPVDSDVKFIALQPDGKILVAGTFTTVGGQTRTAHFARLNPNGTVDGFNPTFDSPSVYVLSLVVQADGKFLITGAFSKVNGTNRSATAGFNADGTLDANFANTDYGTIPIFAAVQPDGKIIVTEFGAVLRYNANNTQDNSFTGISFKVTGNNSGTISSAALQADGKILVGGTFDFVNISGIQTRRNFARLNADGTFDSGFGTYGGATGGGVNKIAVQPDGKILLGGVFRTVNDFGHSGLARLNQSVFQANRISDFDADGLADASIYRNGTWFVNRSNQGFLAVQFGIASDKLAPADYDGDGKTDVAVWRDTGANPNLAYFFILNSRDNTVRVDQFGSTGDRLAVGDWDGDGKADLAVYRDSAAGAQSYFYYRPSAQAGVNFISIPWGATNDKPVRGDFDGDGRTDAAVFRPSTGTWIIAQSSNSQTVYQQFGVANDKLVAGDYDGDGRTDVAVFRDGLWIILQSRSGQVRYVNFGLSNDALVPADYDGDGRTDIAVWRGGTYIILQSSNSSIAYLNFGSPGDAPVASAYAQ